MATVGAYEGAVGGGGTTNPIALAQTLGTYTTGVAATTHVFTLTSGQASTAGNTLILEIHGPGNTTVTSVVDSKGNTYSRDNHRVFTTSLYLEHWSAPQTSGLASGDTVTVTLSASQTCAFQLHEFTNVVNASRVDIVVSSDTGGTNTTPADSGVSSATAQAFELALGSVVTTSGGAPTALDSTSVTAGWANVGTHDLTTTGSFTRAGSSAYRLTSATGTQQVKWNLNFANPWEVLLTTYKAAALSGASAPANTVAPAATATNNNVGTSASVTTGTWTGVPTPSYTYQWQRSDAAFSVYTNISGATLPSYTFTSADVGFKVRAVVTAHNSQGDVSANSNVIGPIVVTTASAPGNTAVPVITGTAQVFATLSATSGTWTNNPSLYRYQWYQVDADGVSNPSLISGATSSQYIISNADVGRKLFVTVTASNSGGSTSASSAVTSVVVTSPPVSITTPVLGGTSLVGSRITTTNGTWTNSPTLFTYQWQRGDSQNQNFTNIAGEVRNYYDLGVQDINHTLRAVVSAINSGGTVSATSNTAGPVGVAAVSFDEHLSDIEKSYIAESPPGLWPVNQSSNFGYHRKVFCDELTIALDQLNLIENERFADTAFQFLDFSEEMLGLPANPAGKTLQERRSLVSTRWRRGTFTNALRNSVIEAFISATAGPAAAFGPSGIPILSGIPLYSGLFGDPKLYYRVTEKVEQFYYRVGVDPAIGVDNPTLIRELSRITPAGITFEIGTDYFKTGGGKSHGKFGGTKSHVP